MNTVPMSVRSELIQYSTSVSQVRTDVIFLPSRPTDVETSITNSISPAESGITDAATSTKRPNVWKPGKDMKRGMDVSEDEPGFSVCKKKKAEKKGMDVSEDEAGFSVRKKKKAGIRLGKRSHHRCALSFCPCRDEPIPCDPNHGVLRSEKYESQWRQFLDKIDPVSWRTPTSRIRLCTCHFPTGLATERIKLTTEDYAKIIEKIQAEKEEQHQQFQTIMTNLRQVFEEDQIYGLLNPGHLIKNWRDRTFLRAMAIMEILSTDKYDQARKLFKVPMPSSNAVRDRVKQMEEEVKRRQAVQGLNDLASATPAESSAAPAGQSATDATASSAGIEAVADYMNSNSISTHSAAVSNSSAAVSTPSAGDFSPAENPQPKKIGRPKRKLGPVRTYQKIHIKPLQDLGLEIKESEPVDTETMVSAIASYRKACEKRKIDTLHFLKSTKAREKEWKDYQNQQNGVSETPKTNVAKVSKKSPTTTLNNLARGGSGSVRIVSPNITESPVRSQRVQVITPKRTVSKVQSPTKKSPKATVATLSDQITFDFLSDSMYQM